MIVAHVPAMAWIMWSLQPRLQSAVVKVHGKTLTAEIWLPNFYRYQVKLDRDDTTATNDQGWKN